MRQKNSVQSGPADQLHSGLSQIEIAGQYGLYVARISVHIHRLTQFNHTAELITTAILRVGQYELCVVLRRHGLRLRLGLRLDCETKHKMPDSPKSAAVLLRCGNSPFTQNLPYK